MSKKVCVLTLLLLAASLVFVCPLATAQSQEEAASSISTAKNRLANGYVLAKATEAQGINVTGLVATLNEAAQLLTGAELAYSAGDYSSASSLAAQSSSQLASFDGTASALKNSAIQEDNFKLITNILLITGALAIFGAGIAIYVRLGKSPSSKQVGGAAA